MRLYTKIPYKLAWLCFWSPDLICSISNINKIKEEESLMEGYQNTEKYKIIQNVKLSLHNIDIYI